MREIAAAILIGFLVLAAVLTWVGRYAIVADASQGFFYVTDRWTGTTYRCISLRMRVHAPERRELTDAAEGCVQAYPAEISN